MQEIEEGEVTKDAPQKETNKDIRDMSKIATLPNDLRDIANQMLEEKFGLATQGEIVDPKDVVIDPKAQRDAEESSTENTRAKSTTTEPVSPSERDMLGVSMEEDRYRRYTDRFMRLWDEVQYYAPYLRDYMESARFDRHGCAVEFRLESRRTGEPCGFYLDFIRMEGRHPKDFVRLIEENIYSLERRMDSRIVPRRGYKSGWFPGKDIKF